MMFALFRIYIFKSFFFNQIFQNNGNNLIENILSYSRVFVFLFFFQASSNLQLEEA